MGWAQATTLIVAIITGAGAVVAAAVTYGLNQRAGRREQQAKAFAEALAIIEKYANMPYRIRRRPPEARHEISAELDKIQSQIAFQHAWLQIEAPEVAAAYDRLIRAARSEAGEQMKKAWTQLPPSLDEEMSLGVPIRGLRSTLHEASASRRCASPLVGGKGEHRHFRAFPDRQCGLGRLAAGHGLLPDNWPELTATAATNSKRRPSVTPLHARVVSGNLAICPGLSGSPVSQVPGGHVCLRGTTSHVKNCLCNQSVNERDAIERGSADSAALA
jgi:hypothetical protein